MLILAAATSLFLTASLDVRDFGAKGDAKSDDTRAFQRALDKAGETGNAVEVPPGRYLIRGILNIPEAVTLEGSFRAPARTIYTEALLEKERGSIILTTHGKGKPEDRPFITLNRSSTVKGLIVFYPEQTKDIVPYPWAIRGIGDNCSVIDMLVVNPYQAVDFGTFPAGRHKIDGLYSQALKTGLLVDKCFDVGRVSNVHFWPFWTDDPKVVEFTKREGTAFVIGRTDWEYMDNCFTIFYRVGYHFKAFKDGPGNAVLANCGADIGEVAVRVDQVQSHAGVSFTNGQMMATVEVRPDNQGPVKFNSCGFWGVEKLTKEHARLGGSGHTTFTGCHFIGWGQADENAYAIRAESGGITVIGCDFMDLRPKTNHVWLGKQVQSAILTGNRFRKGQAIFEAQPGRAIISANSSDGA